MATRYKIQVVYDTGETEFLHEDDRDAVFFNKAKADEQAEFMRMGLGPDEGIVSINVVKSQ